MSCILLSSMSVRGVGVRPRLRFSAHVSNRDDNLLETCERVRRSTDATFIDVTSAGCRFHLSFECVG